MEKKKLFISEPMKDRDFKEIVKCREVFIVRNDLDEAYDILGNLVPTEQAGSLYDDDAFEEVLSVPLYVLAASLNVMSRCDVALFRKGWEKARGCRIEHEAAVAYGLEIIYE